MYPGIRFAPTVVTICGECGGATPEQAEICPDCGYPIAILRAASHIPGNPDGWRSPLARLLLGALGLQFLGRRCKPSPSDTLYRES